MSRALSLGAVLLSTALTLTIAPSAFAAPSKDWPGPAPTPKAGTEPLACVPIRDEDPAASNSVTFTKLPIAKAKKLPRKVHLRDNTSSYNRYFEVTVKNGNIYTRHRNKNEKWRLAPMPGCTQGRIVGISMDAEEIVAVDKNGWLYTIFGVQKDTDKWYWKTAWGSLMRAEDGFQMANITPGQWSLSIINIDDDQTYTDRDGNVHHISRAGCTQVLEMSTDGRHIFSHDPWLPNDYSYEWGTPVQSRFIAESVSASASVALITNKYGDLYTRAWDYDYSGGDPAQFRYTFTPDRRVRTAANWFEQRINPLAKKMRIPVADWRKQPKIPGDMTNRLSVESTAPGMHNRLLKVEGRRNGVTGYWKKMLNAKTWTFVPTGEPLRGKLLHNSRRDRTMDTLAPASPLHYRGTIESLGTKAQLHIRSFAYQSPHQPARLAVGGKTYPVVLHTVYGRLGTLVSQELVAHDYGVTADPRRYAVALELPQRVWKDRRHNSSLNLFINSYLRGERIHPMYMTVTSTQIQLINPLAPGIALSPDVTTLERYR